MRAALSARSTSLPGVTTRFGPVSRVRRPRLVTPLALPPRAMRDLYRDHWAVEPWPLAANQRLPGRLLDRLSPPLDTRASARYIYDEFHTMGNFPS